MTRSEVQVPDRPQVFFNHKHMSKKETGDFKNNPFAGALANLKLPAEEQGGEVKTEEIQDIEEDADEKSGRWSIYDDMTEREAKEYREQQRGDWEAAITLFEINLATFDPYDDEEEAVLWQISEHIDRTSHAKNRVKVGDARRYVQQQLDQIKADEQVLELNYHAILQSTEWLVDSRAKINQYQKLKFGDAYKFTR
jgi:hypothetical protein